MDVVIYQVGDFPGLQQCLESIAFWNPNSRVHLLGDKIPWMAPIPIKPYFSLASEFETIYDHRSVNPREFELRCFQRWMVILEYTQSVGLKEFFVCDSDVLVFADLEKEAERWRGCDFTMPMGSSFFFNARALELFVRFCFWYFRHKNNSLRKSFETDYSAGRMTAISDMPLAERFSRVIKAPWTTQAELEVQVDPNLALIHTHQSKDGLKRIYFVQGRPFGVTLDGRLVRFICLHCWGKAKHLMRDYLRQSKESL